MVGDFVVAKADPDEELPEFAGGWFSLTRTPEELSVVCLEEDAPAGFEGESGWAMFRVSGKLDFGLTGILYRLTEPLAKASVSVFAISTFDTDYLLVRNESLGEAKSAWSEIGVTVKDSSSK
jgi:hypothetical protein